MREPSRAASHTIHGSALIIGERGILIRGESGAGKSSLAQALILGAETSGRYAALVSDDRVALTRAGGRLIARAVPAIAGLLEIRGLGLMAVPYEPAAVVSLVVDLHPEPPRMPLESEAWVDICGIQRPRIAVNRALAAPVVLWRLRCLDDGAMTVR